MDRRTELERRAEEFARRIGAPNLPMSAARAEEISEFARRIGSRHVPPSAARKQEVRDFVRRITEGSWDSAKHPRGGNPQNRGEFSAAGGAAGGDAGPRAGAEARRDRARSYPQTDASAQRRSRSPQIILATQKVERKLFNDWVEIEKGVKKGLTNPSADELKAAVKKALGDFIKTELANGINDTDLADFINSSNSLRTLLGFEKVRGKLDVRIANSGTQRTPKYEIKIAPYGKVGNPLDSFRNKHDVTFEGGLHISVVW